MWQTDACLQLGLRTNVDESSCKNGKVLIIGVQRNDHLNLLLETEWNAKLARWLLADER